MDMRRVLLKSLHCLCSNIPYSHGPICCPSLPPGACLAVADVRSRTASRCAGDNGEGQCRHRIYGSEQLVRDKRLIGTKTAIGIVSTEANRRATPGLLQLSFGI